MTDEQGALFFVGKDVAKALGYTNSPKALRDHVDTEDKTVNESFTVNGTHPVLINESGLYSLILSSHLPSAKAFKRWVTAEVLPQIRRTGGYIPTKDPHTGEALSEEEIMALANEIVARTLGDLNGQNEDCWTATQVAASWGMDVLSFNNLLQGMGIQHRRGGRWQLAEELKGRGLTEDRYFYCFSLKGKPRMKRYLVWTPEGVDFLNMAVRKMPQPLPTSIQLNINFNN